MKFISMIALITFYTGILFTSSILASSKTPVRLNTAPALQEAQCEESLNTVHSIWWIGKSPLAFWDGSTWYTSYSKGIATTWREAQPEIKSQEPIAFSNARVMFRKPFNDWGDYEIRLIEAKQTSECEIEGTWIVKLNGKEICTQCEGSFYMFPTFFYIYITAIDNTTPFRELYLAGSPDERVDY